jgi:hypothetical protein
MLMRQKLALKIVSALRKWESHLYIPLFLEDAGLLAAFIHHSHIVDYAPVDSLSCRLPASSMILGIYLDGH